MLCCVPRGWAVQAGSTGPSAAE